MNMTIDENIKQWTAKRKTALVTRIIEGNTTVADAVHSFDLSPFEFEECVENAKRCMGKSRGPIHSTTANNTRSGGKTVWRPTQRPCWSCTPEKAFNLQGEALSHHRSKAMTERRTATDPNAP